MNRELFRATYQTTWGEWPAENEDEARIWLDFVDTVPDSQGSRLFDAVEKILGESRTKPRLGFFRRAYRGLQSDAGTFAPKKAEGCCLCDDTGYLSLPAAVNRDSAGSRWVFDADQGVTLEFTSFPCRCQLGRVYERRAGLASSVVEEARATYMDYRQAAGHKTEGPYQSREEFLAKPVGCSVVGIMRGVILQSRVATGEIAGEERERVRSQDSSRGTTMALWRSRAAGRAPEQPAAAPGGKDRQPGDEPVGKWQHVGAVADEVIAQAIADHASVAEFPFGAVEPQAYEADTVPF